MLDLLPDLSGRPDWVVVVVVLLLVAGTIGLRMVSHGRGDTDGEQGEPEGDRPEAPPPADGRHALQGSDAQTAMVLTKALDLLAAEAVESQDARAEVGRLRAELLACGAERDRLARAAEQAQAELERCNLECRKLAMRAIERGGDPGE